MLAWLVYKFQLDQKEILRTMHNSLVELTVTR